MPARGLMVRLQFPRDWEWLEEFPTRPTKPPAPPSYGLSRNLISSIADPWILRHPSALLPGPLVRPNVRGPRDEGEGVIEYSIDRLLHGLPDEAELPFIFRSPGTGDFSIPWAIHAENLSEPTTGEMSVRIEELDSVSEIARLDDIPSDWITDDEEEEDYDFGSPPPSPAER